MADIRIHRPHQLGLPAARKIAWAWAEQAEHDFDMTCTYEEGDAQDTVHFTRSGASGELWVRPDGFELHARLGFLLGVFKDRIEGEIVKNLDTLLARKPRTQRAKPPKSGADRSAAGA